MADDKKQWVIRDVPNRTRRIINKWAGDWDVSVAAALERLVDSGEKLEMAQAAEAQGKIERRFYNLGNAADVEAMATLVADLIEKRQREQRQQDEKASEQ